MSGILLVNSNSIKIPLADESVHLCVTSPPFWGLRDYGLPPLVWGGEAGCRHVWGDEVIKHRSSGGPQVPQTKWSNCESVVTAQRDTSSQFCQLCNAWLGCLGLEPTPELYVQHLVMVFREVRRVLRRDGTLWLNLGSSYCGYKGDNYGIRPESSNLQKKSAILTAHDIGTPQTSHFKPKDLIPTPWMVAMALQADGWWLRSAPPWLKNNTMPESVTDRPTTAHENWFLLSRSARYFYDGDAVRIPLTMRTLEQIDIDRRAGLDAPRSLGIGGIGPKPQGLNAVRNAKGNERPRTMANPAGRNRRTSDFFFESLDALIDQQQAYLAHLKHIRDNGGMLLDEDGLPLALIFNTSPYKGAHFATFPPALIEPMIKASTSEYGVCPECGAQWGRVVKKETKEPSYRKGNRPETNHAYHGTSDTRTLAMVSEVATTGWRPTCTCYDGRYFIEFSKARRARKRYQRYASGDWWKRARKRPGLDHWPVQPSIVLDPFVGSGTTCLKARELGRNSVGLDLSFDYLHDQARPRLELDKLAAWEGGKQVEANWKELPLFASL